jgi:hypothetical protein
VIFLDNILKELPMGFGMALMQNESAFAAFSALSDAEKKRVIEGTHRLRSKAEMKAYVDRLGA